MKDLRNSFVSVFGTETGNMIRHRYNDVDSTQYIEELIYWPITTEFDEVPTDFVLYRLLAVDTVSTRHSFASQCTEREVHSAVQLLQR